MFSSELDRVQHSLSSRRGGILLGSALMFAIAVSLVSAKTVAVSFAVVVATFIVIAAARRRSDRLRLELGPVAYFVAAFVLFALLSAAWAEVPQIALEKGCVALFVAAATYLMISVVRTETRPNLLHMGEGVCVGLFVGLLYLLIELLTDQSIKLWLYRVLQLGPGDVNPASFFTWDDGYLLTISRDDLSRNIAPAALFFWPALIIIRGMRGTPGRSAISAGLVLLTVAVVGISFHELSKLALVMGLGAFALSYVSPTWAWRLITLIWVLACIAVVPAALLTHRLDLHNSSWLQASARQRVVIWNFTAEKVFESPWFGTGANMTYVLGPKLESEIESPPQPLMTTLSIHSHNVYLQTWFELGLVGATLLTLIGLSILSAIRSLSPLTQPYAYATFASAASMGAVSYGMWQYWFMALFGLCAVTFGIGARLLAQHNACKSVGKS